MTARRVNPTRRRGGSRLFLLALLAGLAPAPARSDGATTAPAAAPAATVTATPSPGELDASLAESRELIKNAEYDRAIELLGAAIERARHRADRLREAYLLMIKAYVTLANYQRSQPQGHATSELAYRAANDRIEECLRIPELRHTRPVPEADYPPEMVRAFQDVRARRFGGFRVIGLAPRDARVTLDADTLHGRGDGSVGDEDLPPGRHTIEIERTGYRTRLDAIVITPGATVERSYTLVREHGPLWYATRGGIAAGALAGVAIGLLHDQKGAGISGAQYAGHSLEFTPSIRAAGMAGASGALCWGDDTDDWANPALLAMAEGLRYQWGRTQLVPQFAADVFFTSRRAVIGGGGVGVGLPGGGGPDGSARLDYGASDATDESGNFIGTFRAGEDIRAWGLGVDLPRAFETILRATGHESPRLTRAFDAAIGFNRKHADIKLFPTPAVGTDADDYGLLLRATIVDGLDGSPGARPMRLEASYAYSVSSADDALVDFGEQGVYSLTRFVRNDLGARFAAGTLPRGFGPLLPAASVEPLMQVAADVNFEHRGDAGSGDRIRGWGAELALANLVWLRAGNLYDRLGDIHGGTSGVGVGYRYRDLAGFRWDWASIPQEQNSGLKNVHRHGFVVFVNPLALRRR
jgi:hypothetical protein